MVCNYDWKAYMKASTNCSSATTTNGTYGSFTWADCERAFYDGTAAAYREERRLVAGCRRDLPDGSVLIIDAKGNHRIEDKDAKVTYQANRIREFSPHLNASDMVAQFVDYARRVGVKRDEVLQLPLELFIGWLVIEAAERDGDPIPDDAVEVSRKITTIIKPQCLSCGRFIPKLHLRNRFPFCDPDHASRYVQKQKLLTG